MADIEIEYKFTDNAQFVKRIVSREGSQEELSLHKLPVPNNHQLTSHSCFDQAYLRSTNPLRNARSYNTINVVDLFCGCGGLSLGAYEACTALGHDFSVKMAVDFDRPSCQVYETNFKGNVIQSDIWKIVNRELESPPVNKERELFQLNGQIDLLLAGPPCQGNSDLNNHTRREDTRNMLYTSVARYAALVKPKHILVENVLSVKHGKEGALATTIDYLSDQGYSIESNIINLSRIGVPQKRRRHILLASLESLPNIDSVLEKHEVDDVRSVWWAISDLENEEELSLLTSRTNHSKENIERIHYLFEKDLFDLPNHMRPKCHRDGKHSYRSMYGRMKFDEPAQTVTSGFISPGQGRFIHPTLERTITPHEAARLQFFPDFFDFSKANTRRSLTSMIGNSVPMKLGYVLSLELLS